MFINKAQIKLKKPMPKKKEIKNGRYNSYKVSVLKCCTRPSLLQTSF